MDIREATCYRIQELCEQKHLKGYVVSSQVGMPASTY